MAQRRFGSGTSSLLRSAQAAYESAQTYQDSIASFEWDISAKTAEDFSKYKSYLEGRATKANNPSKALTLQRTLISANRAFNSKEIFRASQNVLVGGGTEYDKLRRIEQLYYSAEQNGDDNLAQQLWGQYNNQVLKIENQQIAAANSARAAGDRASASGKKQASAAASNILNGTGEGSIFQIRQEIQKKGYAAVDKEFQKQGVTLAEAVGGLIRQAADYYAQAENYDAADKLLSGETSVKIAPGFSVNLNDVNEQIQSNASRESNWGQGIDAQGNQTITKNIISGRSVGTTSDGQYFLAETRDPVKKYDLDDMEKKLKEIGYGGGKIQVSRREDGTFTVVDPRTRKQVVAVPRSDDELFFSQGYDEQGNEIGGKIDLRTGTISDISFQEYEAITKRDQIDKNRAAGNPVFRTFDSKEVSGGLRRGKTFGSLPGYSDNGFNLQGSKQIGGLLQRAEQGQFLQKTRALQEQMANAQGYLQQGANFNINQTPYSKDFRLPVAKAQPLPAVRVAPSQPLPQVRVAPSAPLPAVRVNAAKPSAGYIISSSSNWGQAAQNLRNAGYNPTDFDSQLKAKYQPSTLQKIGNFFGF